MKKIFIVEDDKSICMELVEILENEGYAASYLTDFEHSKEEILAAGADLILMDINIPGINGRNLLKEIRKESDIPVIMVTSRTSEMDEVLSMSYGADDYITKPYNPTILLLRIAAVLKRMEGSQNAASYRGAEVNFSKGTIRLGEKEQVLTKNEMIIFQRLLSSKDKIVSRDEIMTDLWDNEEYVNDNALTVNISRLRTKLAELGLPDAIETRKKQGYRLI
ncbi:response regulator receiver domain protein [Clostridium sp. CAG:264]|jgi:two-component system response regulator protein GraR|uniref:response regulator transcription factor n=1 Tax=Clostridium sp. L2-50 TaxID=411489 RepID=UPI00015BDED9|nr:response regulator transcription factor [Clostridium sp. L2-50]EDO57647.1 response regulator receiver domain protein [Clostridium sp. L2-50]UEA74556.1 response regulator transcription factor [Lachnospiraceae bacterium GAM79]UEA77752.1 response regulator transcription factor [Lachnospiraceae bacterium GAM79]CCY61113.1 response regulator receiver domain protein [Clostridium sp. CAG:264]